MNKGLKKAAVLGLCAALAMTSLAGCSKKEEETFDATATAVTVNGTEISAGVVKFMTHYMQAATESFYNQYFGAGSMNMAIDDTGATLGDMMKEQNIASLTQMVLAEQHMEEYGVSLTEEEKAAITEAAAAFIEENDEEVLAKMGAAQADIERYLELNTIQVKMEPLMGADVDTEVSDEEAAQRKVQYTLITAETEAEESAEAETEAVTEAEESAEAETAVLEENESSKTQASDETEVETETETEDPAMVAAMEKAYAKAEQIIGLIQGGEEFEAAVASVDEELNVNELTFDSEDTVIAEALITSTEGLEDGTLVEVPVETTSGYYVVKLITQLDREATDAEKEEIIEQRRSELVAEVYTEWEEAAEITQNDDVIAKIVFDFSLELAESAEAETEETTEAVTEETTEEVTEAVTEEVTEEVTEAVTEEVTEAVTEEVTEEVTEAVTEEATEEVTETVTEEATEETTEAVTEAESETEA